MCNSCEFHETPWSGIIDRVVSMELHGTFPWKMSMQKFPWNSMEIGVLMFSMEFHGKCPNPPCKYFPWKLMC